MAKYDYTDEMFDEACRLYAAGFTRQEISDKINVPRRSLISFNTWRARMGLSVIWQPNQGRGIATKPEVVTADDRWLVIHTQKRLCYESN